MTKLAAEHPRTLYEENYGLPAVSLRYFTVYGPQQRPDMVFTRFCRPIRYGDEIQVLGTGDQVRDFTFVDERGGANLRVTDADVENGGVYVVPGGTSTTVNEVLDLLRQISGKDPGSTEARWSLGDVLRTGGSTVATNAATGWTAVSLTTGSRSSTGGSLPSSPSGAIGTSC